MKILIDTFISYAFASAIMESGLVLRFSIKMLCTSSTWETLGVNLITSNSKVSDWVDTWLRSSKNGSKGTKS